MWVATNSLALRIPLIKKGAYFNLARSGLLQSLKKQIGRNSRYAVTVFTTIDCNLGCGYCFQNTAPAKAGEFRPQRIRSSRIDNETLNDAVEFVRRAMESQGLRGLDLLLMGGEPLLYRGDAERTLEAFGKLGPLRADIVTNGTQLTVERARTLETLGLREAQLTFDGDRESHDSVRHTVAGLATFDLISKNLRDCLDGTDIRFTLRVNVSASNLEGIPLLIQQLAEICGKEAYRCSIDIALIDGTFTQEREPIPPMRVEEVVGSASEFAAESGFQWSRRGAGGVCVYCSQVGDESGVVIGSDGGLYSCWDSAGQDGMQVGTLSEGFDMNSISAETWFHADIKDMVTRPS